MAMSDEDRDALQERLDKSKARERKQSWISSIGQLVSSVAYGVCIAYVLGLGLYWLAGVMVLVLVVTTVSNLAYNKAAIERSYQHTELMLSFDREHRP